MFRVRASCLPPLLGLPDRRLCYRIAGLDRSGELSLCWSDGGRVAAPPGEGTLGFPVRRMWLPVRKFLGRNSRVVIALAVVFVMSTAGLGGGITTGLIYPWVDKRSGKCRTLDPASRGY